MLIGSLLAGIIIPSVIAVEYNYQLDDIFSVLKKIESKLSSIESNVDSIESNVGWIEYNMD